METTDKNTNIDRMFSYSKNNSWGKTFAGLLLIAIGTVLIFRQLGYIMPSWLISFKTFLIALGLFIGARNNFRKGGWYVPVIIGAVWLLTDFFPDLKLHKFIWPALLIVVGLVIIFQRGRSFGNFQRNQDVLDADGGTISPEDTIDVVSVFGGAKKIVVSKNFKGGDMVSVFGGSEINLAQADINGTVVIDSVQIFGGAKIAVPANWTVQSDVTAIFGGVDDRRSPGMVVPDPNKILVIDGVCLFGGLTIVGY
ncbi:MAG TPA: LiaF domain-containing protein [Luteibaculaceae bacterium]|nr:LiaF domain-containing protein [Luteibaculaceae bacterium]